MNNIAGINTSRIQRELLYVHEMPVHGRKLPKQSIVFLTGTPVSNSIGRSIHNATLFAVKYLKRTWH